MFYLAKHGSYILIHLKQMIVSIPKSQCKGDCEVISARMGIVAPSTSLPKIILISSWSRGIIRIC
jgi:hypothetical protein